MDHSSHIFRDKKSDDALEAILEPWGIYRATGVHLLSPKNKSPVVGVNRLETSLTDSYDRKRVDKIKSSLVEMGFKGSKRDIRSQAEAIWKEWKQYINSMSIPKETLNYATSDPAYNGCRRYSEIDRILSQIPSQYYNILIHRYEKLWTMSDFCTNWGGTYQSMSVKMTRARKAARKELKKNGYKT